MNKDYINKSKEIIKKHNLENFIEILLDYWSINPTSLGHGFSHVINVAVESYQIAVLNNYKNPEHLFIGGLFHDIHRPAEDKAGEEDQTKGAEITKDLFEKNNINPEITNKVIGAISTHDNWIGSENPPIFDLILSTGDKASHTVLVSYSYIWASNRFCRNNNKPILFSNHFQTLYLFNKYQQRAWNLFSKNPIIGTERAVKAYLSIYSKCANNYLNDIESKDFLGFIENAAEEGRIEELKYLRAFGISDTKIKMLMKDFY